MLLETGDVEKPFQKERGGSLTWAKSAEREGANAEQRKAGNSAAVCDCIGGSSAQQQRGFRYSDSQGVAHLSTDRAMTLWSTQALCMYHLHPMIAGMHHDEGEAPEPP